MESTAPRLTVSRLVALLRETVEDNFVQVLVEGELTNLAAPASGHWYFSLKDEQAQLRAVMFRTQNRLLRFQPENGLQVVCSGRVSVYNQRGELQLIVDALHPLGAGGLQLAFEQLKGRLEAEGLFAAERKRPLPGHPVVVGVVTSATGAAIHDILNVLQRRAAGVRVLLCPVRVQGEGAAEAIAAAIDDLNRHGLAEVLIVGRGGGSLEDLWAFNTEVVARAIAASRVPVISAVGHETDVTIADFVADLRAPTPSAAAELVVASRLELERHLDHLVLRLGAQIHSRLGLLRERLTGLQQRLRSPLTDLALSRQRQLALEQRLFLAWQSRWQEYSGWLAVLGTRLDLLSPLRTLQRGYAIALRERDGRAVVDAASLVAGDRLQLHLARGKVRVVVAEEGE